MGASDSHFIDLTTLSCSRAEALNRIYLILDHEIRQGVTPDMARVLMISGVNGETLLTVPFTDALVGNKSLH